MHNSTLEVHKILLERALRYLIVLTVAISSRRVLGGLGVISWALSLS